MLLRQNKAAAQILAALDPSTILLKWEFSKIDAMIQSKPPRPIASLLSDSPGEELRLLKKSGLSSLCAAETRLL